MALLSTGADRFNNITQCLYNALAEAQLYAPDSARDAFIEAGKPYDAFAAVSRIMQDARHSVILVDPYADAAILERYLVSVPENVTIGILTDPDKRKPNLEPAVKAWWRQHPSRTLNVRCPPPKTLHDRLIILADATVYAIGQSLKDLAERAPTSIVRASDPRTSRLKIEAHLKLWDEATIAFE